MLSMMLFLLVYPCTQLSLQLSHVSFVPQKRHEKSWIKSENSKFHSINLSKSQNERVESKWSWVKHANRKTFPKHKFSSWFQVKSRIHTYTHTHTRHNIIMVFLTRNLFIKCLCCFDSCARYCFFFSFARSIQFEFALSDGTISMAWECSWFRLKTSRTRSLSIYGMEFAVTVQRR